MSEKPGNTINQYTPFSSGDEILFRMSEHPRPDSPEVVAKKDALTFKEPTIEELRAIATLEAMELLKDLYVARKEKTSE